ncbi:MAG: ribonucleoside-diphosphate reductase subunit alpha [Chlamydiota bacterium]
MTHDANQDQLRTSSSHQFSTQEIIAANSAAGENQFTVVKRSGAIVPFHRERIRAALEAAFRDTRKIDQPGALPDEIAHAVKDTTADVVSEALQLAAKNVSLTVEGIQDLVEVILMKKGHHDVARDYIIYRDKHKEVRKDDPRQLKIYRHKEGQSVRFNPMKISTSIEKIFRLHKKIAASSTSPESVIADVNAATEKVIQHAKALAATGTALHLDHIGDFIETALMETGHFSLAKEYILHRAEKEIQRQKKAKEEQPKPQSVEKKVKRKAKQGERSFHYKDEAGTAKTITESELLDKIDHACHGFESLTSAEAILEQATLNFYEGMTAAEIDQALIMTTKAKIEQDPGFATITARFLLDKIYREAIGIEATDPQLETAHQKAFKAYIQQGIELDQLTPELASFDLDSLSTAIDLKRDGLFEYLGLQTLYDRYFIHEKKVRLETPQIFWMRVAMGLSLREQEKNAKAIEFYHILSQFDYVSSTPTLFNSGTKKPQLSSCYLLTVTDDLDGIFKLYSDNAQLSKRAGGIGDDWTYVRATGAHIKGTNGESQGVIPFLKIANDTAVAVNQGGKRKGAMCAYLETWHLDIEDFLELRKNTGDERRRTHDMNTANWVPDLFMKRVKENSSWTLFSPEEVPDLHDLYGKKFAERYVEYEKMAERGEMRLFKRVEAVQLWRKMLSMLFETGHPWITFKDPSNIRSPQDHAGVIHSSNLCTEILLNTSKDEVAVCNLGSINLINHLTEDGIDQKKLAKTVTTAVRMLDNVIDINFYPIPEARQSNLSHRPIGLGTMGFQYALHQLGISYASHEAVLFADRSTEMIAYHAILASSELAKERNPYSSYKGSKWERGLLPIDTIDLLEQERGEKVEMDRSMTMDWEKVRTSIKRWGMRNSNVLALAPTATIANIVGVSASIEPNYKNIYVKSNLSGEFTVCNPYLVAKLKALDLWDDQMVDDLKYFDGSILEIERIPEEVKKLFPTAFEISPEWIIECASRRQKWIDQGQSLNLYLAEPSGKKLDQMYFLAHTKGLKTSYYCRTLGATQVEKSSLDINKRGLQPRWMKSESPSARIKVDRTEAAPACNLDEGCESCQ